ncbi:MAG TPA: Rne/Rng family ribonuclease [Nitrospirae bacterium]|nr:ribonuclease G [bacterium BMS3Abin10]GBE40079.1 ribonuclease G [bacterium BMS3Bbin08]HDH50283.1 Rne/Rng family ribonuclease [Nitrospirota bacterium]HDK81309.1 Rne/Rng family ribonuclease [Nitrospirota bacterium]
MPNEIIINASGEETRAALLESGQLAELYIERKKDTSFVGNVYRGRVVKILPGMQSAFVDVGLEKAAFLHVADVYSSLDYSVFGEDIEETIPHHLPIEDLLQEGEEVMVQVSKDPIGTKGARVTSYVTFPGRYLVLMPGVEHIGISRRISDEDERARLKDLVSSLKPENIGLIIRTASEGCTEEEIKKDIDFLMLVWENIQSKKDKVNAPNLLYSDIDLALRIVRDLLGHDVDRLIIDSENEYQKLVEFVNTYFPKLISKLELYEGDEPIFDAYGIEIEISKTLGKRVWLKSGGYIVIDQTEALTSIDVNTGKYVGKASLEDTLLKTNLEAVREIAYQIRLRNLGGIIIIDFIDMEKEENRDKLFTSFQEAMNKDRVKSTVLQVSEFGLIQMTRKRVRESLGRTLCETCTYCDGRGFIKSPTTLCYEIFRELRRIGSKGRNGKIMINAHPVITDLLYEEEREGLEEIEKKYGFKTIVKADKNLYQEYYEVIKL